MIRKIHKDQSSLSVTTGSLLLLAIILITMLVTPQVANALTASPDTITISQVDVYTGVRESGDQLYIINYEIAYSESTPSDGADDLFLIRLMDASNVQLGVIVPSAYYNNGFDNGVAGMYFSSGEADALGLTFDPTNGDYMKIVGNPMAAWDTGTPPYANNVTFANYYDEDIEDTLYIKLAASVTKLELDWGIDLIEGPLGERTLTTYGQGYMSEAISNARVICPKLFPAAISRLEMTDTEVISDFYIGGDTAARSAHGNTWLAQTFTASLDYELDRIAIEGNNNGGTQSASIQLYKVTTGEPVLTLYTSGTIPGTDFLESPAIDWEECALSPYEVEKDTEYAIIMRCDSGTASWRYDATSTYNGSAFVSTDAGASWTAIANATFNFQTKAKNAPSLSYMNRLEHQLDGTVFDTSDSEVYLGLSSVWVRTLIWFVISVIVAVMVAMETSNSKPITPIIFWMACSGYFIGMVAPMAAIGFIVIAGLSTIYVTVFNRAGV